MPTYDYVCDACGHAFEQFQSITSKATRKCPKCSKLKVRRLIGMGAGIIFKGSGFYCTDYRDKTYTSAAQKDKPASAVADTPKAAAGDSSAKSEPTPSVNASSKSADTSKA